MFVDFLEDALPFCLRVCSQRLWCFVSHLSHRLLFGGIERQEYYRIEERSESVRLLSLTIALPTFDAQARAGSRISYVEAEEARQISLFGVELRSSGGQQGGMVAY